MKVPFYVSLLTFAFIDAAPANIPKRATVQGFDISHYQGTVNFQGAYNSGARFAIIKATEGTSDLDPDFSSHYNGATSAGLIRGGYHFAHPDESTGSAQATFFLANGGGWSDDGITLPSMLDIEYSPDGATCYDLSQSAMIAWIQSFVSAYYFKTTRYPMIYTTNDWWSQCTGESTVFHTTCPLVLASYNSAIGTIPGGWPNQTIWQYADTYTYGGDANTFNGDITGLKKLATG